MSSADPVSLRRAVRRRALGNVIVVLLDVARRTAGRLAVQPLGDDAVLLAFSDVRTMVRDGGVFTFASRDFAVALAFPEEWPFRRAAMLRPVVLEPGDFRHPNSDGHMFCLDLAGVPPQRLPDLLYDNLALRGGHFRLDHCVDPEAAAFVRARMASLPADPRPLAAPVATPASTSTRAPAMPEATPVRAETGDRPDAAPTRATIVDISIGETATRVSPLDGPSFLRLTLPAGQPIEGAQSRFMHVVAADLRAGEPAWLGGFGLMVKEPAATDPRRLAREVHEVGVALRALADPIVARRYLEICGLHLPAASGRAVNPNHGGE